MPPVAGAVAGWFAGMTFGSFMALAATAWALSMSGFGKKSPSIQKLDDKGRLVNTRSTSEVYPLIYGKTRVGGNLVFATTTGTDNKYLHMILSLGEGEVNQIAQVDSVDQIFFNDKLYTESDFADNFYYEFFNGSSTQNVCATLHTAYPAWTDARRYSAYLYYRLEYDRDKFVSIPDITVVLEGLKLKNFATEDDYDSMPMVYTNNLAYCVYDLLTRPSIRGGKELDPTRIDLPSFRDAATYYDTYGWTCNMPIDRDQSIEDNIAMLLANGRSDIIYSNSKFKLKFRDTREESVCMQITENDIIQYGKESTMEIAPAATLFSRPNAVKATFISAGKNYHQDEKVFQDDDAYNDEGDYRELAIELLGLSSLDKVIPMSYYYLERVRWGNIVNMVVGNKGISLEPMDLIEITHRMPGWTDAVKPMYRVEAAQLQEDGNIALILLQEHDDLYNDDYDIDTQELFVTDLPKPGVAVHGVINVSHAEEVYYYRNRSFTRWKIDFDPPAISDYPFWDYAEIWLKIGIDDYRYMTKSTSDYMLDPVEESETYYIKIRSVSIFGVKEDLDSAYTVSKNIVGKTDIPSDMTAITATITHDVLNIFGDEISDPDIIGYEFRISTQSNVLWKAAMFLAFNTKPVFSLSGIKPGSFRVFCSPLDNAGKYSSIPVYVDFTVEEPKGYTLFTTKDCDQPEGSHDNTEYYDKSAGDYCIRVIHTGSLSGKWTSAEKDIGAIRKVRVSGDFLTSLTDTSLSWSVLWPTPNTWDTIDMTKTWSEMFGYQTASKTKAKLKWGNTSGNYTDEAEMFHLISIDAQGRYFQVEVELEDPNESQYGLLDGSGGDTVLTLNFYV
jgi:hypothetical protein